jgi:arylsulfatase
MSRQPNVLVFITDQQRSDTMACYGNDWIQAPRLNAFANECFVFEHPYSAQPVCTPARATLLTGLYPHAAGMMKNNILLDPEIKSIAEMMSDDYHKAYYGKWHLGQETTRQHGFDEWLPVFELPWVIDHPDTPYHQFLLGNGIEPDRTTEAGHRVFSARLRADLPVHLTMAHFLAEKAAEFLMQDHDKPFMLQVHCPEPHPPCAGPLAEIHDPNELPLGPAFMQYPEDASLFNRLRADRHMAPKGSGAIEKEAAEQKAREFRAQYYGMVTLIDQALGIMLDALEKSGQADNTVVVFGSDHGEMAGDHGMMEKRAFYEESAKVPLMMRIPWLGRENRMIPGNIGHVDLVPTLLDLMEQPVPEHLQGVSRVPVLEGTETLSDNDVFIQWNGLGDRNLGSPQINLIASVPWRSIVMADRWKLNLCAGDQCELFDLNSDLHELVNLFDDPTHRDRIRDMAAKIRLWQYETGDDAPLPTV